ncbi:MAG TPA: HD domain-containing protein [Nannocystis sp.]
MLQRPTHVGLRAPVTIAVAHSLPSPDELLTPAVLAGQTGEIPETALTAQIAAVAERVRDVDPARAYEALTAAFCGRHPHVAMQWLRDAGLLAHLLPELDATVAFSQEGGRRHKDVWEHTKAVVRQSVPRPAVRWAAVLHDIGKVTTRRFVGPGKVTFHGHAEEGVRMFRRGPAQRIAFPPEIRERVELLILHHLRPGQYDGTWTDSAVRRFGHEMGPILTDLLDLSRADVTSKRPGKRQRCLALISELGQRIREIAAADARVPPLPSGVGDALMREFALPPGKHIGALRQRLIALCESGEIEARREPEYYVGVVRERGLVAGLGLPPGPGVEEGSAAQA